MKLCRQCSLTVSWIIRSNNWIQTYECCMQEKAVSPHFRQADCFDDQRTVDPPSWTTVHLRCWLVVLIGTSEQRLLYPDIGCSANSHRYLLITVHVPPSGISVVAVQILVHLYGNQMILKSQGYCRGHPTDHHSHLHGQINSGCIVRCLLLPLAFLHLRPGRGTNCWICWLILLTIKSNPHADRVSCRVAVSDRPARLIKRDSYTQTCWPTAREVERDFSRMSTGLCTW